MDTTTDTTRPPTVRPRARRARWGAAAAAGLLLAGATSTGAGSAEEDFVAGSGVAYAQVMRVGPTAGRLSLAPIIGLSLADYLSTVGRGEAKAADWAGIGVAERALPDNTPEVRVTSTDDGAEDGERLIVAGGTDESGAGGGAIDLFARATDAPLGESRFRLGSFSIPGLVFMRGGQAHTTAGVVEGADGPVRQATAVTEISGLDFADGTVSLSGLRWEAIQRTWVGGQSIEGSFTVQHASIAGSPLPIPEDGDFDVLLGPLNEALASTGLRLRSPVFDDGGGVARVRPLGFSIVDSPLGREFVAPILDALRPAREPVADLFIDIAKQIVEESDDEAPDLTVVILAADLALGILSGSSRLHMEFGGVNAFTEGERFESPFGPAMIPAAPPPPQVVVEPGTPGQPGVPPTPGEEGELVVSLPDIPERQTVPGGRGGLAILVGVIGLAIALALAAADYRRIRAGRAAA